MRHFVEGKGRGKKKKSPRNSEEGGNSETIRMRGQKLVGLDRNWGWEYQKCDAANEERFAGWRLDPPNLAVFFGSLQKISGATGVRT